MLCHDIQKDSVQDLTYRSISEWLKAQLERFASTRSISNKANYLNIQTVRTATEKQHRSAIMMRVLGMATITESRPTLINQPLSQSFINDGN